MQSRRSQKHFWGSAQERNKLYKQLLILGAKKLVVIQVASS